MASANTGQPSVRTGPRWAKIVLIFGIALFTTGAAAQFWAIFGGHRLQRGVQYSWDGDWPVYLVGRSASDSVQQQGLRYFTVCTVTPSDGEAKLHEVETVKLTRLGLYGTRIDPIASRRTAIECEDSTVTTGPIVALYDHIRPLEIFGFLFAVIGWVVAQTRDRTYFGNLKFGPR